MIGQLEYSLIWSSSMQLRYAKVYAGVCIHYTYYSKLLFIPNTVPNPTTVYLIWYLDSVPNFWYLDSRPDWDLCCIKVNTFYWIHRDFLLGSRTLRSPITEHFLCAYIHLIHLKWLFCFSISILRSYARLLICEFFFSPSPLSNSIIHAIAYRCERQKLAKKKKESYT